jgi:hypothetical protein
MLDENGKLKIAGDHIDFSFHTAHGEWPSYTPMGSIAAQVFSLGDPASGPFVSLGAIRDVEGEDLDWAHTVDPMHFHGSDQFRLLVGGAWVLAREPMEPGQYGFQEAGRVYQEHPGPGGNGWIFLVYGDRRGMPATLTLEDDRARLADAPEIAGNGIADGGEYPHPAGPKGVPAIRTTAGGTERGYVRGAFADTTSWRSIASDDHMLSGVWGDTVSGPVVYLLTSGPDRVVVPASSYSTEVTLVIARGSCRVGDDEYIAGDLRVQAAGTPFGPVVGGSDGVDAVLMIADRRATPTLVDPHDSAAGAWKDTAESMLDELLAQLVTAT